MTTDHYAEAKYLMGALDTVDQSDLERRPTIYHFDLARAQVLATLALTDAVRALKAGATVTTTHVPGEVEYCVMHDGHAAFGWRGWSRREAESKIADLEDDGATAGAFVVGQRMVTNWEEAPRG